jgi:hypothetical protein
MNDDLPLTLKEASDLYRLKVSTLRAEAGRGRLDVFRIGRRDYTTLEALKDMVRKCQEDARRRASTSTQDASSGSSETARASSAQAALSMSVQALRSGLPNISAKTHAATVRIPIDRGHSPGLFVGALAAHRIGQECQLWRCRSRGMVGRQNADRHHCQVVPEIRKRKTDILGSAQSADAARCHQILA